MALVASLALNLTMCARASGEEDRCAEMLVRSMRGAFGVNIVATMLQRDHHGSPVFERIKVLRSKDGKQHWTVIEPLSRAGIEAIDDGNRWQTYVPDQRLLIDQVSPSRDEVGLRLRISLAKLNYVFRAETHSAIAGRSVLCISACPKCPRLDGRRYYLDQRTAYPLRMETVEPSGAVSVVYDTKDVQFPTSLSGGAFEMHPGPGVAKISYDRPRTVSATEAYRRFGFNPILPKSLPFGFRVQEMQYSGSTEWKSVIVWLTDGLARASVYQWLPDGKEKRPMADSTAGECLGTRLLIVSDNLGADLRQELLGAFIAEGERDR